MSILDQSRNPSRKQESVEEQDLKDSYLIRNVNTRSESESFKDARECRGTGSERFLSGKECQY